MTDNTMVIPREKTGKIRLKLSLMLFLQYMMYAVWWVPLAAYLTNLEVSSLEKSLIVSSMAIGCIFSPVVGMLADRFFAGQKVLAVLNTINAVMLFLAGSTNNHDILFICLLIAMLGYMPSWSLTSSIAMAHLDSEQFPRVRIFGSIGWVASGIFSVVFIRVLNIDFDGTNLPFYCGAAVSFIAILANLSLPDTPPPAKGQKGSLIDTFGLRTIELMKDRNFAVFILFSFLSMIPFAMYFSFFSEFLLHIKTKYISVTMNWGVLAEMGFLLLVTPAIKKFGLRKVMILGLVALFIRYLSFWAGGVIHQSWMFYIGILIHGLIFGFFYVGGQIYIDKKAPAQLKSQAQGFIFLVTFGAGLLVGNFICAHIIDLFRTAEGYNWDAIWGIITLSSALLLLVFIVFFKNNDPTLTNKQKLT
ncbi:MFS transporter [Maribellus luteus]|uniref:MFS transporter n=1 Tax=Maribellus luteus TaxID=2305463 RepID=A0A399T9A5_9BACT|nr:MFS transporter [Maribellus luteus]RIJ50731.1 MFS transporter [Maribellus luteus]